MKFYKGMDEEWYCQLCVDEDGVFDNPHFTNQDEEMDVIDRSHDPYGELTCYACGMTYDHEESVYMDVNGYTYDKEGNAHE